MVLSMDDHVDTGEQLAWRIMNDFERMMVRDRGLHWKHSAHVVKVLNWRPGNVSVKMHTQPVMDVNPGWVEKSIRYGRYASANTLYKAYLKHERVMDHIRDALLCVALFRRSGIAEIASLGKELKEEFANTPVLQSRADDLGVMPEVRIKYAMACANRLLFNGKVTCPKCGEGGVAWIENILGVECPFCNACWSTAIGQEGWV